MEVIRFYTYTEVYPRVAESHLLCIWKDTPKKEKNFYEWLPIKDEKVGKWDGWRLSEIENSQQMPFYK